MQGVYESLSAPPAKNRNTVAIGWQFVVTRKGATPVGGGQVNTSVAADRMAPIWRWAGTKWQTRPGASRCGGSGGGNSPEV